MRLWIPESSDIDDEGYGLYFRDVYPLIDVPPAEARGIIEWERAAANWAASEATNEKEFEEFADAAESFDPDNPDEELAGDCCLPADLQNSTGSLCGLELGVSGLSHSLAATGFYPVASCRSHHERSWSLAPVVLFATEEKLLRILQPMIERCGCGLEVDTTRGQPLFVIYSASILEIMDLAADLVSLRDRFLPHMKTARGPAHLGEGPSAKSVEHPRLF